MSGLTLGSSILIATMSLGTIPIVSGVSYGVVDTAGGGERVVVTVNSSAGCTTIAAGGVNFASFAIDDGTHVSGIPGAHAAGVVDVVVTNASGPSTTGTGLIEYFSPLDLSPTCALLPGDYAVVGTQGVNAVGTWQDSSSNNYDAVSDGGISAPVAASGNPDFVAGALLKLVIPQSLGSSLPSTLCSLTAGTVIQIADPDVAQADGADYASSVLSVGNAASCGSCYSDTVVGGGFYAESYDQDAVIYRRTTAQAAPTGSPFIGVTRWSVSGTIVLESSVNNATFQTVTFTSATMSDGNVGASTDLGQSFGAGQEYDGRLKMFLTYITALSNANVTKIYQWSRQRNYIA